MAIGRNQPCPCGSGRKFKYCCAPARQGHQAASAADATVRTLASAAELLQAGQVEQAARSYRQVLAGDPANAQATHFLGMSLIQAGCRDEGMAALRRSLALAPANATFWLNLGMVLIQSNELGGAEDALRRALSAKPDSPAAHNTLGIALMRAGRHAEAIASFEHALALDPEDEGILNNIGRALVEAGQPEAALEPLRAAIQRAPRAGAPWRLLATVLAQRRLDVYEPGVEAELVQCLSRPDIAPEEVAPAAVRLLCAEPTFRRVLVSSTGDDVHALPLDDAAVQSLARPLFLLLLESVILQEPNFERLIAKFRRAALLAWHAGKLRGGTARVDAALRDVLAAIAHQCFLVEYLHEERDDESPIVDRLKVVVEAELARGGPVNEAHAALYACYRPLATAQRSDTLPVSDTTIFGRLVLRQVIEPAEEAAIAAGLARLTQIGDEVSRAVRAQYEEHPYPRWLRAPMTADVLPLALRLRTLFPHASPALAVSARPSVLIAGCGTGWIVALTALPNPDSRILAIDLSRASLAYAARRARASGLRNVEFAQADILELGGLQERFDIIECAGVLHHLNDPLAGWRALIGLLAPGGKMKVGLYSEIARRAVVAARRLIADRGFAADPRGMRAARAAILALRRDEPARLVAHTVDFYTLSGCRDLLFHVQEHRYTLTRIDAILGDLGLDFLGFEFESDATLLEYRREFPQDPAATSLANWSEFEARHPDAFNTMYQFWVTPKA